MRNGIVFIIGALLLVTGAVWSLQGLGILTGSPMTGQKLWFTIGLLAALAGIGLLAFGIRKSRGGKEK